MSHTAPRPGQRRRHPLGCRRTVVRAAAALLLAVTASPLHAQIVRGRVLASPTERGLDGVTLTLIDETGTIGARTTSAADGRFRFRVDAAGRYTLRVERAGYSGFIAEAYGIGRSIHVGETALGIKGRIGFEAGAALMLIGAHRELEKLVLTKWQSFWKDQLGRFYGDRLHEGHYFDPSLRDIEALFASSQARVTGETRVRLAAGRFQVVAARSPFSMMDASIATYGEENLLWSGDEARAFARVSAIPELLAGKAAARGNGGGA